MTGSPDRPARAPRAPDFPVVLAVAGRRCLVVGGGPVAARKARGLVEAGGRVTVVSPQVVADLERLAEEAGRGTGGDGGLGIEPRPYRSGEAGRYDLVVTATGDARVDAEVVADAGGAGVLVDGADGGVPGSIRLPAVLRRGPVTVAVSTGGASPALARWLRDRIDAALPPRIDTVATLLDEARRDMQAAGRPTDSVAWSTLLDDQVVPLVQAGRIDEARAALRAACLGEGHR